MRPRQSGFTLLESIVAIVILSMGLLATYSWVSVSIDALVRSGEVFSQEALASEALAQLENVDLENQQTGVIEQGDLQVVWEATPVEKKSGVNSAGYTSLYDHTLFDVTFDVRKGNRLLARYQTKAVSSDQVRTPQFEL